MTSTPTPTPSATPLLTPEPTTIHPWPAQLTEADIDAIYEEAGVPGDWRAPLKMIAACESHWMPGAVGDSGNSLGLHQLWRGWFSPGDDPLDPVTNTRVAVAVRAQRGRFGGAGGWTCADLLNLP